MKRIDAWLKVRTAQAAVRVVLTASRGKIVRQADTSVATSLP